MWTPDRIARLSNNELKNLHNNALFKGANEVAKLCAEEAARRAPQKEVKRTAQPSKAPSGSLVIGYHFVCKSNRGVIDNCDSTFWTGSWIVSRSVVDQSLRYGAYVALHEARDQPSYRQGKLLEYRMRERDMVDKENIGIEFKVLEDGKPRRWVGDGTAEKGYLRRDVSAAPSSEDR